MEKEFKKNTISEKEKETKEETFKAVNEQNKINYDELEKIDDEIESQNESISNTFDEIADAIGKSQNLEQD